MILRLIALQWNNVFLNERWDAGHVCSKVERRSTQVHLWNVIVQCRCGLKCYVCHFLYISGDRLRFERPQHASFWPRSSGQPTQSGFSSDHERQRSFVRAGAGGGFQIQCWMIDLSGISLSSLALSHHVSLLPPTRPPVRPTQEQWRIGLTIWLSISKGWATHSSFSLNGTKLLPGGEISREKNPPVWKRKRFCGISSGQATLVESKKGGRGCWGNYNC